MTVAGARPSWWLALAGLLAAPLVAAIVNMMVFDAGVLLAGHRPASHSLREASFVALPFALVWIPSAGILMSLFWRRAPFGPLPCSIVGAVAGALAGYLGVLILSYPQDYSWGTGIAEPLSNLVMIGLGIVSGIAAGVTFWLISRLRPNKSNG